jgi:hypothetical protein
MMEEEMRLGQQEQQKWEPEPAQAAMSKSISSDDGEERRERRRKRGGKAEQKAEKLERTQPLQAVDVNARPAEAEDEEVAEPKQMQRRRRVLRD